MILRAEDPRQVFFTSRWEMVQDEELVRTVDEVVNQLDLGPLYACWREGGRGFYDPGMLLELLFFGYCDGERYSRKIAKRIKYDIRYQYFAGSRRPSYRTICRFRNIDVGLLAHYFARIVSICQGMGLLDPSLVVIDGSKIKASASRKRTMRRNDLARLIRKHRGLLSKDAARDLAELGDESDADDGERKRGEKVYRCLSAKCRVCQVKSQCTTGRYRELWISEVWKYEQEMNEKLRRPKGSAVYRRRKVMVEPVFGNVKFNLGFDRYVVRGLRKVKGEFLLMCIAHNLKKFSHYWRPAHQAQSLKTALVTSINPLFRSVASWVRKLFAQNHLVHRKLEFMYQE